MPKNSETEEQICTIQSQVTTLQMAFFYKNYQFLKYARGYLRKGRYAPKTQQQTEPMYGIDAGISTLTTLVGGECSHHCLSDAHL